MGCESGASRSIPPAPRFASRAPRAPGANGLSWRGGSGTIEHVVNAVRIPWFWVDLGEAELAELSAAMRARRVNQGALCAEFEGRLAAVLGCPHTVVCNNGSSALAMALLACGVGPGDEVVVPASTFIATANAAVLIGAGVRLVDVEADRPLIDAGAIEAAIGPRTKALVAVHLNGAACDMTRIASLGRRLGLAVIEDSAQAFASRDASGALGVQSHAGTFSTAMSKLICTGEGGFVAVRDAALDTRLRELRNHGTQTLRDERFPLFGFNFRMTDLTAAIGLAQLAKLPAKVRAVRRIYQFYRDALSDVPGVRLLRVDVDRGEVPAWVQVVCADRARVVEHLAARGIQTRLFHACLADSPHFRSHGEFPRARFYAENGLVLPCGPDQPQTHLEETVEALRAVAREIGAPAPACPV